MLIPVNLRKITPHKDWTHRTPFPPLGFLPFFECELGNGDTFGLYWPIGRENYEPLVVETWHDSWQIQPTYSSLDSFLAAAQSIPDEYPEPPTLSEDPNSPRACFQAAKESIKNQDIETSIQHLETAVVMLPEYTDALSLLWQQYVRSGRIEEAVSISIRAIISPPSFGERPLKALRWLCSQPSSVPSVESDPIWLARSQLKLVFGGKKENADFPVLLNAINGYLAQSQFLRASTLMQTYAELMSAETVSFQERYEFNLEKFIAWQIEVSSKHNAGTRNVPAKLMALHID